MPDWAKIILDLCSVTGNARQLARMMNYGNPDYLRKMARDEIKDPPWSVGDRLMELYKKHVREEIPMQGVMQQRALIK